MTFVVNAVGPTKKESSFVINYANNDPATPR